MIGSGIFIVSADIARLVDSPALLILAWVVTGFMTVVGALTYGELAAMMPRAGGQYVFLRESLGPLWGFLYGWSMFAVIQTGTIAAIELRVPDAGYLASLGPKLNAFYLERDVLLRTLGNVVYVLPPYCVRADDLDRVYGVIDESLAFVRV